MQEQAIEMDSRNGVSTAAKSFKSKTQTKKRRCNCTNIYLTINISSLKKNISAVQWDQMFLNLAKELKMKKVMVVSLWESATQTSKAMDKIAESISYFDKALGDGLVMIAMAIAPPQRQ